MIVFGIHAFGKIQKRAAALKALVASKQGKLVMVGNFLEATVRALDASAKGKVSAVGGCLDDILLPPDHDGFGQVEWRESWLAYLESHNVAFLPLKSEQPIEAEGTTASIIRGYNRAAGVLADAVRKLQVAQRRDEKEANGGYICGRPPYGYGVKDGTFVVNETQAKAVKLIFQQVRSGSTPTQIIAMLKKKHASGGVIEGKKQYWDRVKIRRILSHSHLYCLGRYGGGRGQEICLPLLAFLPSEWADTHMPRHHHARPTAAAAT